MEPEKAGLGEDGGPFSGFGTFARISAWVEEQLEPLGLRWDGTFVNSKPPPPFPDSIQTNRGAVWFKATGEPNLREFPLTLELAACFPGYVPVSLATHPEWNAWLSLEAEGQDLWSSTEPGAWLRAAILSPPCRSIQPTASRRYLRPAHMTRD